MQKKHGKYFFKDNLKNKKKSSASYFFIFIFKRLIFRITKDKDHVLRYTNIVLSKYSLTPLAQWQAKLIIRFGIVPAWLLVVLMHESSPVRIHLTLKCNI